LKVRGMSVSTALCMGVLLIALVWTPAGAGTILSSDLTSGGTATAFPSDTPPFETPSMAFDDLAGTKGLIFNDVANDNTGPYEDVTAINPVIWTYAFAGGVQQTVTSYSLTSANDAVGRDPRDFFLEGSNSGTTWTTVDTVTGHVFNDQPGVGDNTNLTNRFETYFFNVDTPGAFSQYRLRVIETFGTTEDRPQLAEIQYFATTAVPVPATLALLGVGLAAFGIAGRKR
jgi:hypothetical protein